MSSKTKIERALENYRRLKELELRNLADELGDKEAQLRDNDKQLKELITNRDILQDNIDEREQLYMSKYKIRDVLQIQLSKYFNELELKILTDNVNNDEVKEMFDFKFDLSFMKIK